MNTVWGKVISLVTLARLVTEFVIPFHLLLLPRVDELSMSTWQSGVYKCYIAAMELVPAPASPPAHFVPSLPQHFINHKNVWKRGDVGDWVGTER